MTKGIPQKYLAFEKFLEENEDWREKVVLVQIAIPPRTDVATCTLLWWLSFPLFYAIVYMLFSFHYDTLISFHITSSSSFL